MSAPLSVPSSPFAALTTFVCLACAYLSVRCWWRLHYTQNMPGYRPLFDYLSLFGFIVPKSRSFLWMSSEWYWHLKGKAYFDMTHDIITIIPLICGRSWYCISSNDVAMQITGAEAHRPLPKVGDALLPFKLWGESIFVTHGEEWKKHRRIVGPAFARSTYEYMQKEAFSIYSEMLDAEGWTEVDSFAVQNCATICRRFAFLIIGRCGFGFDMAWKVDAPVDPDDEHSQRTPNFVQRAIDVALKIESNVARLSLPSWAYKLPIRYLRDLDQTYSSLEEFMHQSYEIRMQELSESSLSHSTRGARPIAEKKDVFSRLVAATQEENEKASFGLNEVIGNLFLLFFAGHETVAMVLAATISLLALHPEEQDCVYDELTRVLGDEKEPGIGNLEECKHLLGCFLEAARLYPPGPIINRTLDQDVVVRVESPAPREYTLKKGMYITLDMVNMHRNPRTFPNPNAFLPSRWADVPETKFTVFGVGPRACLGRKFAQLESLAFLSSILREWKVDVVLNDGETREGYMERVMDNAGMAGMTFGIVADMSVKFTRRK